MSLAVQRGTTRMRAALAEAMCSPLTMPGVCGVIIPPSRVGWTVDLWLDHKGERYRCLEAIQDLMGDLPEWVVVGKIRWAIERMTVCALLEDNGGEAKGLEVLARELRARGVSVGHLDAVTRGDGRLRVAVHREGGTPLHLRAVTLAELAVPGWQVPLAEQAARWDRMDPCRAG